MYKKRKIRALSTLLSAAMVLQSVPQTVPFVVNILAEEAAESNPVNKDDLEVNSTHFIVRYWNDYETYTVIDGYIQKEGVTFKFFINEPSAENSENYVEIAKSESGQLQESNDIIKNYIDSIDWDEGTITLKAPSTNFYGFSVSSGHYATEQGEDNEKITIKYDENNHLVKIHAMYKVESSSEGTLRKGTFRSDADLTDKDIKINQGEVSGDEGEQAPSILYNNKAGLHTNESVSAVENDPRAFDVNIEAWHNQGKNADIGLVLDASGSMAYTSDNLSQSGSGANIVEVSPEVIAGNSLKRLNESAGDLKDVVLSQEDVEKILNNQKTDKTPYGTKQYNYYIYDPRNTVAEFNPIGYWDGYSEPVSGVYNPGNFPNGTSLTSFFEFDTDSIPENIRSKDSGFKTVNNYAENGELATISPNNNQMSSKGFSMNKADYALMLDNLDLGDSFTISFNYSNDLYGTATEANKLTNGLYTGERELLYIGPEKREKGVGFRVVATAAHDKEKTKVNQNLFIYNSGVEYSGEKEICKVASSNFYGDVTITYDYGNIKLFVPGYKDPIIIGDKPVKLTGDDILTINGVKNGEAGSEDDVLFNKLLIFKTAFTEDEVGTLQTQKSKPSNEIFNDPVNVAVAGEGENKKPYAIINSGWEGAGPGWYYINHSKNWSNGYNNPEIQTGKTMSGIKKGEKYQVNITDPNDGTQNKLSEYNYTPDDNKPLKFLIDNEGKLICLFTTKDPANNKEVYWASYVYETEDANYVKSEALQRAINLFVTRLTQEMPDSQVSAVKFSTPEASIDLDKLVLMDWTNNSRDLLNLLNPKRSEETSETSQYAAIAQAITDGLRILQNDSNLRSALKNAYGLTGNTETWTGLQSFLNNLAFTGEADNEKYLILFTDGKDTELDSQINPNSNDNNKVTLDQLQKVYFPQNKAVQLATKLKNEGYTIFTVLLTGGTVTKGSSEGNDYLNDYEVAKAFLQELASKSEKDYKFFFSTEEPNPNPNETAEVDNSEDSQGSTATNGGDKVDTLTRIFSDEIFDVIAPKDLTEYTVQQYIDPRFNIVNDDDVYYLKDDGNVYKNGDETDQIGLPATLSNNAVLDFDGVLYYLKWTNQTIPSKHVGIKDVLVWENTIRLKAKDDFLGGRSVLLSGYNTKQNLVYPDKEFAKSSSGIALSNEKQPSKGIPRVIVDVPSPDGAIYLDDQYYKGEESSLENLKKIIELASTDSELGDAKYYWQYLERYSGSSTTNESYDQLLSYLIINKQLSLQYYYLRDENLKNQAGNGTTQGDNLGKIVYKITYDENGNTQLVAEYQPTDSNKRNQSLNEQFILESDYKWNAVFEDTSVNRSKAGSAGEGTLTATLKLDEVSGDIKLKVKVENAPSNLSDGDNLYSGDLRRYVNGQEEKVGTFTAQYKESLPLDSQEAILTVEIPGYESGLPYGTYYLLNQENKLNEERAVKATTIEVKDSDIFDRGTLPEPGSVDTCKTFAAERNGTQLVLGATNENGKANLNQRFGIFQVTVNGAPGSDPNDKDTSDYPKKSIDSPVHGTILKEGSEIRYKIEYKNDLDETATVTITDRLDPGLDFESADNDGTYDESSRKVTWVIEDVPAGDKGEVYLTVTVNKFGVFTWDRESSTTTGTKDNKVENQAIVMIGDNEKETAWIEAKINEPNDPPRNEGGNNGNYPAPKDPDDPKEPEDPEEPDTETPDVLETSEHYAYIIGRLDGLSHPKDNIHRDEVVTIYLRLLKDDVRKQYWSKTNNYPDVYDDLWCNNAISTMTNMGIIQGYDDGLFRPGQDITRAEFVKMAVSFFNRKDTNFYDSVTKAALWPTFSDTGNHWAVNYIEQAARLGLVRGYEDGTFKPNQPITRAEAITIFNRVLGRKPHRDGLYAEKDQKTWADNMDKDAWYYAEIQEATNSHEHTYDLVRGDTTFENWISPLPIRNWGAFEQTWSNYDSSSNPGNIWENPYDPLDTEYK